MALDRHGQEIATGETILFREINQVAAVVAVAEAGVYIRSETLGDRFVADSDRCFEALPAGSTPRSRCTGRDAP